MIIDIIIPLFCLFSVSGKQSRNTPNAIIHHIKLEFSLVMKKVMMNSAIIMKIKIPLVIFLNVVKLLVINTFLHILTFHDIFYNHILYNIS